MHKVLICPVSTFHLAFGLDWLPLISGRASSAARRVARQRKASHIVLDGEAPASFGYGLVRGRGRRRAGLLHSAAQNMARLYPSGSVAAIIPIESYGHWLVALHEGAVMARSDVVYRSSDQALEALEVLQRAHPRLRLIESSLPSLAAIAGASDAGTALRSTGRRARRWSLYLVLAALLCLSLILFRRAGAPATVLPEVSALSAADIESRWLQAITDAEQGFVVHGVSATHVALRQLYDIPAHVAGWVLGRAICRVDGRWWHCNAEYERRHRNANNRGLIAAVPDNWRLDFPTMDRAGATWGFATDIVPLQQSPIERAAHNRRYLQSAWQAISPAFGRMALGPARTIELDPPRGADGSALPRPSGLPVTVRRPVEFDAPLRSISLLLPYTGAVGWRSFALTLGQHSQSSLASSRLRATLHGDLYELHDEVSQTTPVIETLDGDSDRNVVLLGDGDGDGNSNSE